ncbi:chondroitin AC lyase [Coprinopsis cinerea okayama7|uniref:Chondroitin AC lyase n=1 Tax=Coprinopsis cinerea (strain Okayama-7 / 130 / ATCC MYA-4618 / FGSC 9003) TaxID=240176 RepID=A8N1Q4_COPC7|nr:chondroitin AC lyase [Coprinopsis cinerea okayama7\|eukprot:XP_001828748.2 chondroitin AC lyase [Coprinopsis cinerea okayama7\
MALAGVHKWELARCRLDSLDNLTGKWPDTEVDYTTGCGARRANWPAQAHWQRILVMSGAWHGGYRGAEQWVKDERLRTTIGRAMEYWFSRDITNVDCLDWGGTPRCPCDNVDDSLWNTNWFSNIILIPRLAGQSCLLLSDSLTLREREVCSNITRRSFGTFGIKLNQVGYLTGANTLDVARVGIDCGLLNSNISMIADAYRRIHDELVIQNVTKVDGIRADGSFAQHAGVLYNGNYGKDYSNAVLDVEVIAAGTSFSADTTAQTAFETLFDGHRWMIFSNTLSQVLHFDFSVLGRFITFPVIDDQATGSIQINLTKTWELGRLWSSPSLTTFGESLMQNFSSANAGGLTGTRMFFANDYMVHRGPNFFSSLKMYSSRTLNTECINSQNPLGFHLSDGTLYTYLRGNEYTDISAAWDWDLIPGTTVDYRNTLLHCSGATVTGRESFVGGLSDGKTGIAAMRYTNPTTRSLRWQKTWFFLNDGAQHVVINILASSSGAPVYSVLDQKRRNGLTVVDRREVLNSSTITGPQRLWHDNVGYAFRSLTNATTPLHVRMGERTGSWSAIGTSTQPPVSVDMWAGLLEHIDLSQPLEYTILPGTSYPDFLQRTELPRVETIANNDNVTAIYDQRTGIAMVVFWNNGESSIAIDTRTPIAQMTITSTANVIVMFSTKNGTVLVSDPTQMLDTVVLKFTIGRGKRPLYWKGQAEKSLVFQLPGGGRRGDSVSGTIR